MYLFDSKIVSRGYHVYRNSTWQNMKPGQKLQEERQTNNSSKSINSYASAIKIKQQFFDTCSRHCYFFMEEGDNITGYLISTIYTLGQKR